MKIATCMTAFALATGLTLGNAQAASVTISPEVNATLDFCDTFSQRSLSPTEQKTVRDLARAIVKADAEQGNETTPRNAASLCTHLGYTVEDRYLQEGQCNEPILNGSMQFQLCRENGEVVLGKKGAWPYTDLLRSRDQTVGQVRNLMEALTKIETGEDLDSSAAWSNLHQMITDQKLETTLKNGECATNPVSVSGHTYDIKLCEQNGKLAVGKGAVKMQP